MCPVLYLLVSQHHILPVYEVSGPRVERYVSVYWCDPSHVDIHRRDLVDKDSSKNYINFVHLNLCIALAIGLLIFMAGIQGGSGSTVSFVCFYRYATNACSEVAHTICTYIHALSHSCMLVESSLLEGLVMNHVLFTSFE